MGRLHVAAMWGLERKRGTWQTWVTLEANRVTKFLDESLGLAHFWLLLGISFWSSSSSPFNISLASKSFLSPCKEDIASSHKSQLWNLQQHISMKFQILVISLSMLIVSASSAPMETLLQRQFGTCTSYFNCPPNYTCDEINNMCIPPAQPAEREEQSSEGGMFAYIKLPTLIVLMGLEMCYSFKECLDGYRCEYNRCRKVKRVATWPRL